jgi:hypothetical protein
MRPVAATSRPVRQPGTGYNVCGPKAGSDTALAGGRPRVAALAAVPTTAVTEASSRAGDPASGSAPYQVGRSAGAYSGGIMTPPARTRWHLRPAGAYPVAPRTPPARTPGRSDRRCVLRWHRGPGRRVLRWRLGPGRCWSGLLRRGHDVSGWVRVGGPIWRRDPRRRTGRRLVRRRGRSGGLLRNACLSDDRCRLTDRGLRRALVRARG